MIISTNLQAVFTNEQLGRSTDKLSSIMEKLSSGFKINSSKDDSVGMALSETLKLQLRGLERGSENATDGTSVIETAEGALIEVNNMITRLRQLAVQGANATNGEDERNNIQMEVEEIKKEINRISKDTDFNGIALLAGDLQRDNYVYNSVDRKFSKDASLLYFSEEVKAGTYALSYSVAGGKILDDPVPTVTGPNGRAEGIIEDDQIVFKGENGFQMQFEIDRNSAGSGEKYIEIKDTGRLVVQVGHQEGQKVEVSIPKVDTKTLGIDHLDLTTQEGCERGIQLLDTALTRVLESRGKLGAVQNRLEHTIASHAVSEESVNNSISKLIDTDMAKMMTEFTTYNVIQQTGISMLAQANQQPEKVLQLLQ